VVPISDESLEKDGGVDPMSINHMIGFNDSGLLLGFPHREVALIHIDPSIHYQERVDILHHFIIDRYTIQVLLDNPL